MIEVPFEDCWWVSVPSAEEEYMRSEDADNSLDCLTPKQRFVMELRYGIKDGNYYTQRQVAELMGVNRSTVWKIEQAAKKKLLKGRIKGQQKVSRDD